MKRELKQWLKTLKDGDNLIVRFKQNGCVCRKKHKESCTQLIRETQVFLIGPNSSTSICLGKIDGIDEANA